MKTNWDLRIGAGEDPGEIVWHEIAKNVSGMLRGVAIDKYLNNFASLIDSGTSIDKAIDIYKEEMGDYFLDGYDPSNLLRWFVSVASF